MSAPAALITERKLLPSGALSLLVHAAFVGLLFYTVQWQNHPSSPVQAEIWNSLPALPAPAQETRPEPPPPPPVPVVKTPAPVEAPPPVLKPAIVVEKAPARPLEPPKKPPPPDADADRTRLAREEAALKQLDRNLRAEKAREQAEQAQRDQAEERRLADAQRAADARQRADAQQAQSNMLKGAQDRLIAKIRENTLVPASVPAGIAVQVKFVLLPDGSVLDGSIHVVSSSGSATYDDAVQRAILASQPLPMPDDPLLRRAMRDISLRVNNLH